MFSLWSHFWRWTTCPPNQNEENLEKTTELSCSALLFTAEHQAIALFCCVGCQAIVRLLLKGLSCGTKQSFFWHFLVSDIFVTLPLNRQDNARSHDLSDLSNTSAILNIVPYSPFEQARLLVWRVISWNYKVIWIKVAKHVNRVRNRFLCANLMHVSAHQNGQIPFGTKAAPACRLFNIHLLLRYRHLLCHVLLFLAAFARGRTAGRFSSTAPSWPGAVYEIPVCNSFVISAILSGSIAIQMCLLFSKCFQCFLLISAH